MGAACLAFEIAATPVTMTIIRPVVFVAIVATVSPSVTVAMAKANADSATCFGRACVDYRPSEADSHRSHNCHHCHFELVHLPSPCFNFEKRLSPSDDLQIGVAIKTLGNRCYITNTRCVISSNYNGLQSQELFGN